MNSLFDGSIDNAQENYNTQLVKHPPIMAQNAYCSRDIYFQFKMTDTAFLFKKPRVDFSVMTSGNQKTNFTNATEPI